MITLATDQPVFLDASWLVLVGGDYAADALVECYKDTNPEQRVAYYASYISSGEYPQ